MRSSSPCVEVELLGLYKALPEEDNTTTISHLNNTTPINNTITIDTPINNNNKTIDTTTTNAEQEEKRKCKQNRKERNRASAEATKLRRLNRQARLEQELPRIRAFLDHLLMTLEQDMGLPHEYLMGLIRHVEVNVEVPAMQQRRKRKEEDPYIVTQWRNGAKNLNAEERAQAQTEIRKIKNRASAERSRRRFLNTILTLEATVAQHIKQASLLLGMCTEKGRQDALQRFPEECSWIGESWK